MLDNIDGFVLKRIDLDLLIKICLNNKVLPEILTKKKHISQVTKSNVIAEIFEHKDDYMAVQKILEFSYEPQIEIEHLGDSREL
ncbi:hypothetical protein [Rickettsia endosymbiont of Halotydeus destructor]|uniref:hypothetical protein n=1 Tax=Rickettsia endosymbiont of Halotydeus destructor TaxID=2996754 RepID=UPI003BAE2784